MVVPRVIFMSNVCRSASRRQADRISFGPLSVKTIQPFQAPVCRLSTKRILKVLKRAIKNQGLTIGGCFLDHWTFEISCRISRDLLLCIPNRLIIILITDRNNKSHNPRWTRCGIRPLSWSVLSEPTEVSPKACASSLNHSSWIYVF